MAPNNIRLTAAAATGARSFPLPRRPRQPAVLLRCAPPSSGGGRPRPPAPPLHSRLPFEGISSTCRPAHQTTRSIRSLALHHHQRAGADLTRGRCGAAAAGAGTDRSGRRRRRWTVGPGNAAAVRHGSAGFATDEQQHLGDVEQVKEETDSDVTTTGADAPSSTPFDLYLPPTHVLFEMSESDLESYVVSLEESQQRSSSSSSSLSLPSPRDDDYRTALDQIFELMKACGALDSRGGAQLAERLLAHCMLDEDIEGVSGGDGDDGASSSSVVVSGGPTPEMYSVAMDAWARAGTKRGYGARRAQQILELMWDEWRRSNDDEEGEEAEKAAGGGGGQSVKAYRPNVVNYSVVLKAWAKSGEDDAPRRVMALLAEMEEESSLARLLRRGDATADDAAAAAAASEPAPSSTPTHSPLDADLIPDRICYNTAISAWSRSSDPRAPDEIRSLMRRMERLARLVGDGGNSDGDGCLSSLMPNTRTYNMLIHSFARVGGGGGGGSKSQQRGDHRQRHRGFDRRRSLQESAALEAEAVLREMYDVYMDSVQQRDSGADAYEDRDSQDEKDDEDDDMVRPNIACYNGVLNAWSNVRTERGPHRVEEILRAMLDHSSSADASESKSDSSSDETSQLPMMGRVEPNIVTYNIIVNSWAKSGLPEAGERAEAILNYMNGQLGRDFLFHPVTRAARWTKDAGVVRPNVITYNATMNAWAKSSGAAGAAAPDDEEKENKKKKKYGPERAERLLRRMLLGPPGHDGPIRPNTISFSTCIFAWSRSSDDRGAERAESLLGEMEILFRETGDATLRPSGSCYGGVVFAWANRGDADRAEAALVRMKRVGGIQPITSYYNAVLEALARKSDPAVSAAAANVEGDGAIGSRSNGKRARSILEEMITAGEENNAARPDAASFNYVIEACGLSNHGPEARREAFFTAVDTFNRLRDAPYCQPDETTYVRMLETIYRLLPNRSKERTEVCEDVFKLCREDGLLNNEALHLLRKNGRWALQKMLGLDSNNRNLSVTVRQLPGEWSRNVGNAARRGRRRF